MPFLFYDDCGNDQEFLEVSFALTACYLSYSALTGQPTPEENTFMAISDLTSALFLTVSYPNENFLGVTSGWSTPDKSTRRPMFVLLIASRSSPLPLIARAT